MENRDNNHQRPLAEALKPLAAALRSPRSTIRAVSQVNLTLRSRTDADVFETARNSCLHWLDNRSGRRLPDAAWQGETFELDEVGSQRVGAAGLGAPRYWAARLDDADKNVAQRTWVTEIGLGQTDDARVLFGVRSICVTRGEDQPYERTIPGFVRSTIELAGASLDGRSLVQDPWFVNTKEDVDALARLLLPSDPRRRCHRLFLARKLHRPEPDGRASKRRAPSNVGRCPRRHTHRACKLPSDKSCWQGILGFQPARPNVPLRLRSRERSTLSPPVGTRKPDR